MFARNRITDLFGIKYPILQAPMAIVTNPRLAANAANAGGLGSLGCAVTPPETMREQIREFRELSDGAHKLHINFFVHDRPARNAEEEVRVKGLLQPFYDSLDAGEVPDPSEKFFPYSAKAHAVILEERVEIVSFHFGLPSDGKLNALKANGALIMSSATTVAEAKALEAKGVDAIIAQSWEAGGHRGTFLGDFDGGTIGGMSLIPQIVDAVSAPVIAAGGIADGRGVVAALALGASAVQLGTAFLLCPESNVTDPHRKALRSCEAEDTRLTRAFSGRPARSLRNRYLDEYAPRDHELLPFPLMNPLSGPLRAASDKAGLPDGLPLWSGQSAPMISATGAADVVANLVADTERQLTAMVDSVANFV